MKNPRYLTKSRFKLACECPTKLFYTGKPDIYPDKKSVDPFLTALAKGGFQVGELAKCYFPGGIEVKAARGDYDDALRQTNELLGNDDVTIFEAAVAHAGFFIRVDVLIKSGRRLEVIEVKSKSFAEGEKPFFGKRDASVDSTWKPYLYDVAFQKFVVQNAFPGYEVSASLMLADKTAKCPTDGLNQKFRVVTSDDGQKFAFVATPLTAEEISSRILCKVPVDDACERIFSGTDEKTLPEKSFADRAREFADFYQRDERIGVPVSGTCKSCEFRADRDEESAGKRNGFKECWTAGLAWTDEDFLSPTIFDIWSHNHHHRNRLISENRIKLSEFRAEDITINTSEKTGMSASERQWMQIEKLVSNDASYFLDHANLRAEMSTWKFPLHFIDFETATPAIPFNKGRRPYEEIAFQFSHHVLRSDGTIEHAGQYLNDTIGEFPNFAFLRALRDELDGDDGTIFRYAAHENTYLNAIHRQLNEFTGDLADREELCAFIRKISKSKKDSVEPWEGERNMVDMRDMVLRFYFDPRTNGSNSIKQVLPAILNSSQYLKAKYSKPVYGTEIRSLNFPEGRAWVEFDGETVKDPYALLPKMFGSEMIDRLSDEDELKDGGAAMMAYARLQFEDMSDIERAEIRNALLRYCELDTFAMVMIYEGWREMLKEGSA